MLSRVLLADNHDDLRRRIRSALEAVGFEICGEATNGLEAIEKTRALQPDLVIMELRLPVLNGLEAIPEIAKSAPGVKIVIFSVDDDEEIKGEAFRRGAHGYVSKASALAVLINVVNELLNSHNSTA